MKITKNIKLCFLASLFVCYLPQAYSAVVGIEVRPMNSQVKIGDVFEVGVFFTGDQFYATSDIELDFDNTVIQFNQWTPAASLISFSAANSKLMSESAPFSGNLADSGSGLLLATLSYLAVDLGTTNISVDPASFLLFTAPGASDPGELANIKAVNFSSANVQVVPVPAAVWMFSTGLLAMVSYSRRKNIKGV